MKRFLAVPLLLLALIAPVQGSDVLRIEITEGVVGAAPIAVVPFAWEGRGQAPEAVAGIIEANLARSGRFSPLDGRQFPQQPSSPNDVNFRRWREAGVDHVLVGRYGPASGGGYEVRFHLLDVLRESQIAAYRIPAPEAGLRRAAHRVSDIVYEAILDEPGAFDTRIAYILAAQDDGRPEYRLMIADSDGYNARPILVSRQPLMSPAWSPDGRRLAYVSFEGRRSQVMVQDLGSGERERVSSRRGINGAPAWSPDGRRLALALSEGGNVDIYVMDMDSRDLRRITRDSAINTEPSWSPDGRQLAFTSDRGGPPQIYTYDFEKNEIRRLTFEGRYNARPRFSPDGETLAVVHGRDGRFTIAAVDLRGGGVRILSGGPLDESPDFSPNGAMIIHASRRGDRGELATVSVDGQVRQRLSMAEGQVREPAWSPLRSR